MNHRLYSRWKADVLSEEDLRQMRGSKIVYFEILDKLDVNEQEFLLERERWQVALWICLGFAIGLLGFMIGVSVQAGVS